jgi:uncharacterized phage protein (TIGR01671 family)
MEYIFQQFTGLQDKNGRDIYDGDIVRGIDLNEGPKEAVIVFDTFGIIYADKKDYLEWWEKRCYSLDQFYTEIIGNIFENPELLK